MCVVEQLRTDSITQKQLVVVIVVVVVVAMDGAANQHKDFATLDAPFSSRRQSSLVLHSW